MAFFGVNFILQKFCPCKKNDKLEVCTEQGGPIEKITLYLTKRCNQSISIIILIGLVEKACLVIVMSYDKDLFDSNNGDDQLIMVAATKISVTITSVASPGQRYWWAECSTEHWVVLIFLVIFVWSQIDMIILDWLFYLYNESDIDFFDVVNANFKISDWFHKSEIAFWISVSTFQ